MFVVVELQTMSDGTIANIVTQHTTLNEAESKYHQVLSSAAISNLPIHSAVLLNAGGMAIEHGCFEHGEVS